MKRLIGHIGQKCDLTGALNGLGELTLMHSTGTGCTAGKNLAALGKETAKFRSVLIINVCSLVNTELAYFSAATIFRIVFVKSHDDGTSFSKIQMKSDQNGSSPSSSSSSNGLGATCGAGLLWLLE